jgi:hypothetical protein
VGLWRVIDGCEGRRERRVRKERVGVIIERVRVRGDLMMRNGRILLRLA